MRSILRRCCWVRAADLTDQGRPAFEPMMGTMIRILTLVLTLALSGTITVAQTALAPDTSKLGPQVGQAVPPLEGVDQFGRRHTLSSIAGPRGTMLVFFRSADW
jgi:hypothetical protein